MNPNEVAQIGPYAVVRFVAEGGMAWVFEVSDPRFEGRRLALKMLKPEAAQGEEFQRFVDEARLLAAIDHPNLVTIFDEGKDDDTGCFFYTMNFIDGPTMAQRISEGGPFSVEEGVRLFVNVLDGLGELHRRGIVHRDIKPANVLIGSDGRPRLADLGIARQTQESGRTRTGTAIGTVHYMSPQQARGQSVDVRSDVFSLGVTLYEALTGHRLYDSVEDLDSTSSMEVLGYLVSLSRTGQEIRISYPPEVPIPPSVREVIETACRFYPEDRYADATEMRQALEQALRQEPVVTTQPTPRWLYAVAAGVAVAAIAGASGYFMYAGMQERESAETSLAGAQLLQQSVPALLERVKDLEPAPARGLLERADDTLERATNYMADCEEELEIEAFEIAARSCERAQDRYEEVCAELAGEEIGARAQTAVDGAGERLQALRAADAAEHVPEEWAALEGRMAALGAPEAGAPCAMLAAHLDRIDGAAAAQSDATRIEGLVAEIWPQLAETARNEALKEQSLAEADVVAEEYQLAREGARSALAQGQELEEGEDYRGARDAYADAAQKFKDAAAIVPAAEAQAEVRRFEAEMPEGVDLGKWSVLIARADDRYAQRDWSGSAELYREALLGGKARLGEAELERDALSVRATARAARERAVAEGAERSAASAFQGAEAALAKGGQGMEERRYEDARQGFADAQEQYVRARDEAIQNLAAAREAGTQARRDLERSCAEVESSTAREECDAAKAEVARADQALEAKDGPSARSAFQAAIAAAQRSRAAEDAFQVGKPRPPVIASRTPKRDKIETFRDKPVKLAVEAEDPNQGTRLRYAWSFAGRPVSGSGPEIELSPEASGVVSVEVADETGLTDTASWNIEVVNRRPKLSVTPRAQKLSLKVGASAEFGATATDPDGDPVKIEFRLDGRRQASGGSFRFDATKPGRHELEIVASDASGGRTAVTRTIVVARVTPPPQDGPGTSDTGRSDTPEPPWQTGVRSAFRRYEGCLNDQQMGCLENVWLLSSGDPYRQYYTTLFKKYDSLQFNVTIVEMEELGGNRARVLFDQTQVRPTRTIKRKYDAKLLKRKTTNEWQIIEMDRAG